MDNPLTPYELASSTPNRSAVWALETLRCLLAVCAFKQPVIRALLKRVLIVSDSIRRQRITHYASCCGKAES